MCLSTDQRISQNVPTITAVQTRGGACCIEHDAHVVLPTHETLAHIACREAGHHHDDQAHHPEVFWGHHGQVCPCVEHKRQPAFLVGGGPGVLPAKPCDHCRHGIHNPTPQQTLTCKHTTLQPVLVSLKASPHPTRSVALHAGHRPMQSKGVEASCHCYASTCTHLPSSCLGPPC